MIRIIGRKGVRPTQQQQQQRLQQQVIVYHRRLNSSSSTTASSSSTTGSTSNSNTILSRRVWYQIQQQQKKPKQPDTKTSSTTSQKTDDTPWPRSIQIAGYFSGFVIVPYFIIWYGVNNKTLRDYYIFPFVPKSIQEIVRNHYGIIDLHSIPYVDRINEKTTIPHNLLYEPNSIVRNQQDIIKEQTSSSNLITVRFYLKEPTTSSASSSSNNKNTDNEWITQNPESIIIIENIPASTVCNKGIIATIQSIASKTAHEAAKKLVAYYEQYPKTPIAIDFPYSRNTITTTTTTTDTEVEVEESASITTKTNSSLVDLSRMNIYSYWYYINPEHVPQVQQQQQQKPIEKKNKPKVVTKTNNNSTNDDAIRYKINQLQYEIQQLQQELQAGATFRSVDTIQEEIIIKQKEIRTLQWQISKWKLW